MRRQRSSAAASRSRAERSASSVRWRWMESTSAPRKLMAMAAMVASGTFGARRCRTRTDRTIVQAPATGPPNQTPTNTAKKNGDAKRAPDWSRPKARD